MGNLCSKSANKSSDNFAGPGRRIGGGPTNSATPTKTTHPVPQSIIATTPGRTLTEGSTAAESSDPRAAAARAAEERSKTKQGGKLARQLNEERSKTQSQHLADVANANLGARAADENRVNSAWN